MINLFGPQSLNVNLFGLRMNDAATKAGRVIDCISGGKTQAEKIGRAIDEVTKDITIDISKK